MKNSRSTSYNMASNCRNRRVAQARLERRGYILMAVLVALIIIVAFASINVLSCAKEEHSTYKYYTSIMVEKGDTLWSIAEEYSDASISLQEYISEVKTLNHLVDDEIHQGAYLTVPYYSAELK